MRRSGASGEDQPRSGTHTACRLFGWAGRCSNSSGGWRRIDDANAVEGLEHSASSRRSGDLWSGIYRVGDSNYSGPLRVSLPDASDESEVASWRLLSFSGFGTKQTPRRHPTMSVLRGNPDDPTTFNLPV